MSYGFTQIILLFLFESIYIIINQGWMVLRGKDVITLKCVSFEIESLYLKNQSNKFYGIPYWDTRWIIEN